MKASNLTRILLAVGIMFMAAFAMQAQNHNHDDDSEEQPVKKKNVDQLTSCWKLIAPLGLREQAPVDTLPLNYYKRSIPSFISPAYATTGNLGAEGLNMIWHERPAMSDFFFRDALLPWILTHDKMRFYNSRIPMTLMSFNTTLGKETAQERLKAVFSGNINAQAQVGANIDYLYSRGSYANQATKDLTWGLNGSYLGDRYEMQAYFNHYNMVNMENGGITDMLYITDPAELQGGVSTIDSKSIPVKLSTAYTRLTGDELYVNNRYKVGFWDEKKEGDSIVSRTYVPVTSFIYTLKYNGNIHTFVDKNITDVKNYFQRVYLDPKRTYDKTSYYTVNNTLGVSLLEGFSKWSKFGLAAYATYQVRHYTLPTDTLDHSDVSLGLDALPEYASLIPRSTTQQLAWVGAQLTKQKGSLLRYEATAELGILGPAAGEVKVDGRLSTRFPLLRDSLEITAFGGFRNEEAPWLMQNYISNHFIWHNDFGKRRTVMLGGEIDLRRTGTYFRASVSNMQNHIYFNADGYPVQHGGNVQVLSLTLRQNLAFGIWHWDNDITYQTTSDDKVIPLPSLAVYSNMYLLFNIATLNVQLGVDCDYYTRYYTPGYNPATASFTNQREYKFGNYPFCNAYAQMKLSRARFYVMYSHANKGIFGGDNYFSMPFYPLNPARFQMGVSVDFAN